ncbi:MAG: GNAT family N-acetyltransferase [Candidatus Aminicenantales bacterium]
MKNLASSDIVQIRYLRLSDEREMKRWDEFASAHPKATPFHLSGWLKTISETYAIDPWLVALEDANGKIAALTPFFRLKRLLGSRRLVCLPFSDYCFPLGLEEAHVDQLLLEIIREPNLRAKSIEIRGPIESPSGFSACSYYKRHLLRLNGDPQEVLKGVDKRTIKYNIRKARKEGVEIIEENSTKGIDDFFRLYVLTRKKHGVPHQPVEFFRALARNIIDHGHASLLFASQKSLIIAAGLFLRLNKVVYYKYNVSDPYFLTKTAPNHLLTWTAIERACLDGFEYLDFGRTAPDNAGLMRHKQMWGAGIHDLPYFYHPPSSIKSTNVESGIFYKLTTRIWRRLPEPMAAKLGPVIMKYLA